MAMITWGPQLELGFKTIDEQHRNWTEIFNELDRAQRSGRGAEVLGPVLDKLLDYTFLHFKTEEGLMSSAGYEELSTHEREHRVFADQIMIFRDKQAAGFMNVTPAVVDFLRSWLILHITASDRGYITCLKEAGVS
jgi:hemerythrin